MPQPDIWSSLNEFYPPKPPDDDESEKIERIFYEIAEELGIADIDSMPGSDKQDSGATIIYDKFSGTGH
jgi:hypothetical protein